MNLEIYQYKSRNFNISYDRYDYYLSIYLKRYLKELGNDVGSTQVPATCPMTEANINSINFIHVGEMHEIFEDADNADQVLLCDDVFIVMDKDTKNFVLVDIQDGYRLLNAIIQHDKCVGVVNTFYDEEYQTNRFDKSHLIVPGHYFPLEPRMTEDAYERISKIEPTDKRLFFSGTIGNEYRYTRDNGEPRREVALILKEKYPDDVRVLNRFEKYDREEWFEQAANHYINLALPGHPWCSREHELWCLGLPILSTQWTNPTVHCPIPNYHYLSAYGGDKEWHGTCKDPEYAADKLYERYKKSIDNPEYLKWIGNNGRKYYLDYIKPQSSAKYYAEMINGFLASSV